MLARLLRPFAFLLATALVVPACSSQEASDKDTSDEDDGGKKKKKKKKSEASASAAGTQTTAAPKATAAASTAPTAASTAPTAASAAPAPEPAAAEIPALAVGQWLRYEERAPEKTIVEYRVVRQVSDKTFVLELEAQALTQTTITEMEVELKDRSLPEGMVIHKARVKTPTGLVTLPPSGIGASLKFAQNDLVLPSLATGKKADVTVPAGTFKDCAVREHAEADPTGKMTATAYAHPSVPINGFVKYEGTVDGRAYVRELVAFGLTGAKAKL